MKIQFASLTTLVLTAGTFSGFGNVTIGGKRVPYLPSEAPYEEAQVATNQQGRMDIVTMIETATASGSKTCDICIDLGQGKLTGVIHRVAFDPRSQAMRLDAEFTMFEGEGEALLQSVDQEGRIFLGCRFEQPLSAWPVEDIILAQNERCLIPWLTVRAVPETLEDAA